MRLSVRRWPRVRFSVRRRRICPGEKKRTLRKSALWDRDVTKKRTLAARLLRAATHDLLKTRDQGEM